jgi:hypothetical protein
MPNTGQHKSQFRTDSAIHSLTETVSQIELTKIWLRVGWMSENPLLNMQRIEVGRKKNDFLNR